MLNDLWVIGVVGSGAGAAVGAPLLLNGRRRGEPWTLDHLVGLWLLGSSLAMLLVGVRHGALLTPGWDLAAEIVTDVMSLAAWTTLVSLTRRIAGIPRVLPVWSHLILPAAYVLVLAASGFPDVPFLWLIPVGALSVCAVGAIWHRSRTQADGAVTRQVGAVFAFVTVFCSAQAIRGLFPDVLVVREIVPAVVAVSIFAIAISLSRRRTGTGHEIAAETRRYRKSGLTSLEAERLAKALDAGMESAGWYRDVELSLAKLAARLDVPPQTLSQALNQRRGQSLTEYLTQRRLRDVKQRILDPANDCFTVDGLATQAGFASRSAFYKAFRESEGVTPAQYRRLARGGGERLRIGAG